MAGLVVGEGLGVLLEAQGVEAQVARAVHGAVAELEEERNLEEADEPQDLLSLVSRECTPTDFKGKGLAGLAGI